jgi:NTP pyrophosphatase (non-canonical NTP hydrolase)
MTIETLQKFIQAEAIRLKKRFGEIKDQEKLILSSTVKIMEELGELSELVLKKRQRQDKINFSERKDVLVQKNISHHDEALEDEFADVIISTAMLAHDMDIDIEKALKNKMKKIEERYK